MRLLDMIRNSPLPWHQLPINTKNYAPHVVVADDVVCSSMEGDLWDAVPIPNTPIVPPARQTWIEGKSRHRWVGALCETHETPPALSASHGIAGRCFLPPFKGDRSPGTVKAKWWIDLAVMVAEVDRVVGNENDSNDICDRYGGYVGATHRRGSVCSGNSYLEELSRLGDHWKLGQLAPARMGSVRRYLLALGEDGRALAGWINVKLSPCPSPEYLAPPVVESSSKHGGIREASDIETDTINALGATTHVLGLLNCRNVITLERAPARHFRRHWRGVWPPVTYHVLDIKPGKAQLARANRKDIVKGMIRRHFVRGHFKTYTDQHRLCGKNTGTWYWGPTVRGNQERGVVLKSYRLRNDR